MNLKELEYEFHDSVIDKINYLENDSVELVINLYEIFYPEKPRIKLRLLKVKNFKKIKKYFDELLEEEEEEEEDGYIGCKVNRIIYDEKKSSQLNNLYIFFSLDWIEHFRVNCEDIKIDLVAL